MAPRCDLCEVAKVSGLCPSKRHVKLSPKKLATSKVQEKIEEAEVKVELEPAVVDGKVIEGRIVKNETSETGVGPEDHPDSMEERTIKEEHDGQVDESSKLVW